MRVDQARREIGEHLCVGSGEHESARLTDRVDAPHLGQAFERRPAQGDIGVDGWLGRFVSVQHGVEQVDGGDVREVPDGDRCEFLGGTDGVEGGPDLPAGQGEELRRRLRPGSFGDVVDDGGDADRVVADAVEKVGGHVVGVRAALAVMSSDLLAGRGQTAGDDLVEERGQGRPGPRSATGRWRT